MVQIQLVFFSTNFNEPRPRLEGELTRENRIFRIKIETLHALADIRCIHTHTTNWWTWFFSSAFHGTGSTYSSIKSFIFHPNKNLNFDLKLHFGYPFRLLQCIIKRVFDSIKIQGRLCYLLNGTPRLILKCIFSGLQQVASSHKFERKINLSTSSNGVLKEITLVLQISFDSFGGNRPNRAVHHIETWERLG